jgi:hypothetical protein
VKRPVFSFEAEILTDAPFAHIAARLMGLGSPGELPSLRPLGPWQPLIVEERELRLGWTRRVLGTEECGSLVIRPEAEGARLRLEGRLKGWGGFLRLGLVRWRTDRLLDRFVEDL